MNTKKFCDVLHLLVLQNKKIEIGGKNIKRI